jgi:hypothetical protein
MSKTKFSGIMFATLLAIGLLPPPCAQAGAMSERTKMTFQQPVEVSGYVLPPGSYYFARVDDGNDSNVNLIRVFDARMKRLELILQTAAVDRERPRGRTVLTFAERAQGQPPALLDWFFPGSLEGHEFLYSAREERQIAHSEKIIVASNSRGDVLIRDARDGLEP